MQIDLTKVTKHPLNITSKILVVHTLCDGNEIEK